MRRSSDEPMPLVLQQRRDEQERDIGPAPRPLAPADGDAVDFGDDDAVEPFAHRGAEAAALGVARGRSARQERQQVALPGHKGDVGEGFDLDRQGSANGNVERHRALTSLRAAGSDNALFVVHIPVDQRPPDQFGLILVEAEFFGARALLVR